MKQVRVNDTVQVKVQGAPPTPSVNGCTSSLSATLCHRTSTNKQLNFLLAAYDNPSAKPGTEPSTKIAQESLAKMRRRSRFAAFLAGASDPNVADEGLSRAIADVAASRLIENYRPEYRPLKYYFNYIIGCRVREVAAEQRGYKPLPLSEQILSREPDPARTAELNDLASKCDNLLTTGFNEPIKTKAAKSGSSTSYGRKHRSRKRKWQCISCLFPNFTFRPMH